MFIPNVAIVTIYYSTARGGGRVSHSDRSVCTTRCLLDYRYNSRSGEIMATSELIMYVMCQLQCQVLHKDFSGNTEDLT